MISLLKSRAWILFGVVTAGFATALFLPKNPPIQNPRLQFDLPDEIGGWKSKAGKIGAQERNILAKDTEFRRREYRQRPDDNTEVPIDVSVVFSGRDMNNSIHRPEVCLRAQGWNFKSEETVVFNDVLPGGEPFPMRKIVMEQPYFQYREDGVKKDEKGEPLLDDEGNFIVNYTPVPQLDANGQQIKTERVSYYTFFGADTITASHWGRVGTDMLDRIRYGYDQRWAYLTIATEISDTRFTGLGYPNLGLDLAETDARVHAFLRTIGPSIIGPSKH